MEKDNLTDFDGKNVTGRLSDISNKPFDTDQLKNKKILVGKENINVGDLASPLQTPVKSIKNKKNSRIPLYLGGKKTTPDISNKSNNLLSMKNKTFDDVASSSSSSSNVPLPESPKISHRKSIRTEAANVDVPKIKKQITPLAVKLDKNLKVKTEKDKIKNKGPMKAVLPLQNMVKPNATTPPWDKNDENSHQ